MQHTYILLCRSYIKVFTGKHYRSFTIPYVGLKFLIPWTQVRMLVSIPGHRSDPFIVDINRVICIKSGETSLLSNRKLSFIRGSPNLFTKNPRRNSKKPKLLDKAWFNQRLRGITKKYSKMVQEFESRCGFLNRIEHPRLGVVPSPSRPVVSSDRTGHGDTADKLNMIELLGSICLDLSSDWNCGTSILYHVLSFFNYRVSYLKVNRTSSHTAPL